MAYVVDRVVICDAFGEPDRHYQLLPGGKSKRVQGRRPSMRFLASAKDVKGGIAGVGRFFFCQQEAIEAFIYLYDVQKRRRMPETGDLVRYALKLVTGTGKTVVMALLVVWSTLHRRKVSGSSLSANFLVLVPNLTVRDRVSGVPRGDGLGPSGEHNLYDAFEVVPPEYRDEFHPNVVVRNWQGVPLEGKRDDWIPEEVAEEGRFIPAAVLRAMRRRAQQDPSATVRRMLGGWRDLVVINDEAHHVYGEKRARKDDFEEWGSTFEFARGPSPVLLCVADNATRAAWLFEHLTREYELLRNPDDEDRRRWVTIQVDSKVFDADRGNEAVLREMVNTVGRWGKAGEHVRCIVSVNMLSEGWDVQSVSHILGLRAFGSPLLTEQIIGRGLRRTNYDVLNQPLEERPEGSEETVDGVQDLAAPVQPQGRRRPLRPRGGRGARGLASSSSSAPTRSGPAKGRSCLRSTAGRRIPRPEAPSP